MRSLRIRVQTFKYTIKVLRSELDVYGEDRKIRYLLKYLGCCLCQSARHGDIKQVGGLQIIVPKRLSQVVSTGLISDSPAGIEGALRDEIYFY